MPTAPDLHATIADVVRQDRGRLLSALIAGLGDFELAEEALSEAVESALVHWNRNGPPLSPVGWLLKVARRKAIDRIRRAKRFQDRQPDLANLAKADEMDANEPAPDIPDERLRLIFTCCHPAIDPKSRVALTLRTIGGLTTPEIARAFLDKEPAMAQRLSRAKAKITAAAIPFAIPEPDQWDSRLASVLSVIYLIFNQGHSATSGPSPIRNDLCQEAIFLARMLNDLRCDEPEILGLLSLMLSSHARRSARISGDGMTIPMAEQDRARWDHGTIAEAAGHLDAAIALGRTGPYQLKAAISVLHSAAPDEASTDWRQICLLYDSLWRFEPTPVVALNRAVALAEAGGLERALAELLRLAEDLHDYQPYHAACAEYLARSDRTDDARASYDRAIALAGNAADAALLVRKRAGLAVKS